jgi:peptidyl-prolyl cis-trans isomerase C
MSKKEKIILLVLCASFVLICACSKTKKAEGPVIAEVNGEAITLDKFKTQYMRQSRFNPTKYATEEGKKELLDDLINNELLFQEAKKVDLSDDEQIKNMMVRTLVRKKIDYTPEVTDEELKKHYDAHQDEFEEARISDIELRVNEAELRQLQGDTSKKKGKSKVETPKTLEELDTMKKARAEEVLNLVKGGKDFAELAKKYSENPSRDNGGDLGYYMKGRLMQELSDAAFALKNIGDTSEIIKTRFGYHIIKLTDKRVKPLEEQKPFVRARLMKEKRDKAYDDYVATLKKSAKIKIHEDKLAELDKQESPHSPHN